MIYEFSTSKYELYPYVLLWFKRLGKVYDLTPELEKKEYSRLVEFNESSFLEKIKRFDDGLYAFNLENGELYYCDETEWTKRVERWLEYSELAKNKRNRYEKIVHFLPKSLQVFLQALGFGGD